MVAGTVSTFMQDRKAAYLDAIKAGNGSEWTVAMGNEAGDLDSIASAIAYAWYASKVQGTLAISLTQTPRSELHLRAENQHALELANIKPDTDILCIDDIPYSDSPDAPFPSTKFALVDHNRLHPRFDRSIPDARVVAVIDHHEDEGLYRDTADPRIIAVPTGSCASLITQLFEDHLSASSTDPDLNILPPEIATLLLCSILIDTNGLKPGGKAEAADHRAARFLMSRMSGGQVDSMIHADAINSLAVFIGPIIDDAPHETPGIHELHTSLQEKKESVAHLGTLDLLKRDYKEYVMSPAQSPTFDIRVGLSSVPVGFASWLPRHEDFWSQTEKFMQERSLTVLGILTSFRDPDKLGKNGKGKHRREQMYVVREDGDLAAHLFEALEDAEELRLKRKKFPELGVHNGFGDGFRARVWQQKNVDATRKATAPLVKNIISGHARNVSL